MTPLSFYSEEKIAGVFIHAQIIAQLRDDRNVVEVSKMLEFVALFILAALGFYLGYRFQFKQYDFIVGIIGISLLIAGGVVAFIYAKTILPSTSVSVIWILSVYNRSYLSMAE